MSEASGDIPKKEDLGTHPPSQTSDREYQQARQPASDLLPMSPRERELMNGFKRIIAQHLEDVGGKTTSEFLEGVALELWRLTRKQ